MFFGALFALITEGTFTAIEDVQSVKLVEKEVFDGDLHRRRPDWLASPT